MKACLGQKVKISLPKAYQTAKPKKSLVVKGVPAEVTEQEFKDFFNLNKINYSKAERFTSEKDGGVLEILKLDIEAEALITENLTCPITGIIYRVEKFRTPISVQQCWNCQNFCHSAKTCRSKTKCVISGESHHHKGCPNKEKSSHNAPILKDHMLHPTKGVQHTKNRNLENMWWPVKNHMPQFYAKTHLPRNPRISADQIIKFVANVAIQVDQDKFGTQNPPRMQLTKSQVCVAEFLKLPKIILVLTSRESACLML